MTLSSHDVEMAAYNEEYAPSPPQRFPTTHDLQIAAAQGDSSAAQLLERYASAYKSGLAGKNMS